LARRAKLGERRERWQDQTTGPASALFNALFLAAFALSAVLAIQAYQHAQSNPATEGQALTRLYLDAGELPNGGQLRTEIRDYASTLVNQEWPLLPQGSASATADQQATALSDQILAIKPADNAAQTTRNEALSALDQAIGARQQRLLDTHTQLPWGLLICLIITAVVMVGHGLLVGLPHTTPSLVSLLVEAAVVAGAVFIVFAIRQPYHGALAIGPDQLKLALARFR
jgi:hypothetical protein